MYWAEEIAEKIIERNPNKPEYVCAAGISPSGSIHIGNFRDIATSYFVTKALRKKGKSKKSFWVQFAGIAGYIVVMLIFILLGDFVFASYPEWLLPILQSKHQHTKNSRTRHKTHKCQPQPRIDR